VCVGVCVCVCVGSSYYRGLHVKVSSGGGYNIIIYSEEVGDGVEIRAVSFAERATRAANHQ